MSTVFLISICVLMLFAYVFDLTSKHTRIPSVVLLMLLGWFAARLVEFTAIKIPDLNAILPVTGTIGLILIVLEGGLELEVERSKTILILKAFFLALIPMLLLSVIFAVVISYFTETGFLRALLNTIPFSVISSAIAIPSVRNLDPINKELVIYESSFSDIIGVLIFNFLLTNHVISFHSFAGFAYQTIIMIAISSVAIILLSLLLSKLTHHITYTPIIILIILIYSVAKLYHLPALIFVLVFSLFLGNIHKFGKILSLSDNNTFRLEKGILKFKEITYEATFLVRSSFFLLFGFLISTSDVLNTTVLPWSLAFVTFIIIIRYLILRIFKLSVRSLLFIAPRGLITVLLYISIAPEDSISLINNSMVIQTIILSILIMMAGMFTLQKYDHTTNQNPDE